MNIEVMNITNPQKEAVVRVFQCCICEKHHLKTGKIADIWYVNTEESHVAAVGCVPENTPVWS